MELLLKLTPADDVQQHVLPMLYRGLDSDSPQIHELCLSVLPTFAGLLDHANVKNSLLPRIKRLCLTTNTLSVRVNCLLCVGRLLEHLDKWLVLDEVLPFLPQIPSREPAVLMGILGIYKLAMNHKKLGISKEIIASRILPFLIPLCIENGLTIAQFNALVALVKDMFQLVETEHRTKLEQLNSVKDEQKALSMNMPEVTSKAQPAKMDNAFTGLGLETFANSVTILDKQNLAQQQEAAKLFTAQPSIEPLKIEKTKTSPPKDLTSSLIQSPTWSESPKIQTPANINLNLQMQTSSSPMWNGPPKIQSPPNINMGLPMQNYKPPINQINQQGQWGMNQNANPWSSSQPSTNMNFGKNTTGQNWSALDNLLPTTNANRMPMNQMSFNQPLIPPSNNNTGASGKLSSDDIMDLLS